MRTPKYFSWRIPALFLIFVLTACGGGGGGGSDSVGPAGAVQNGGGGGDDQGGDDDGGGTGGDTTVISFGAIIGGTFVQGQAAISIDTLSAGGTADVTVNLVDQNGTPVTETFTVSFTSNCVADGTATLETDIDTIGGQAVAEYVANGCVGLDEIRATVNVDGDTLIAIATITVAQENIGSIEFVSADPNQIALVGTGGDETSRVTFRVVGEAGGPIQDATVNFALNSSTGGLALTDNTATSNSDGEVSTIVQAGTIATSVRVTATEASTGISTQSSQLVVSTGIPDSDSFSLSVTEHNPEALNFDGEEITFTIRAADAFNNPVPENTAVSFFAEGGSIDSSCTTDQTGACTVVWRSQDPRPADGRATILASAIGNESFTDQNGNGRFEDGEPFDDLGEAFADEDESGDYDVGEFFIDFGPGGTPDGARNLADGLYNGVLCDSGATQCSADRSIIVSDSIVISMSGSNAATPVLFQSGAGEVPPGTTISAPLGGTSISLVILSQDINGNSMPGGTVVTSGVTTGLRIDGSGGDFTVFSNSPNAAFGPSSFSVTQTSTTTAVSGTLTVTFTTPNGIGTTYTWPISP